MAARTASIRQACAAIPTRGMADDPQFSRSYLATDAAVKQLQRCLREQYSLGVQARNLMCCIGPLGVRSPVRGRAIALSQCSRRQTDGMQCSNSQQHLRALVVCRSRPSSGAPF